MVIETKRWAAEGRICYLFPAQSHPMAFLFLLDFAEALVPNLFL